MTALTDDRWEARTRPLLLAEVALGALAALMLLASAGSGFGGDYPVRPIVFVVVLTGASGFAASELIARDPSVFSPIKIRSGMVLSSAVLAVAGAFVCGEAAIYPLGALFSVAGLWRILPVVPE